MERFAPASSLISGRRKGDKRPAFMARRLPFQRSSSDKVGHAFGHHHRCQVGVGARHLREDRSVDHTQPIDSPGRPLIAICPLIVELPPIPRPRQYSLSSCFSERFASRSGLRRWRKRVARDDRQRVRASQLRRRVTTSPVGPASSKRTRRPVSSGNRAVRVAPAEPPSLVAATRVQRSSTTPSARAMVTSPPLSRALSNTAGVRPTG